MRQGVNKLIEFLKKAFDVEVKGCSTTNDGTIMHAEVLIGDSWIMLGEDKGDPKCVTTPTNLYMYVPDTDKVYNQAIKAGGVSVMEQPTCSTVIEMVALRIQPETSGG